MKGGRQVGAARSPRIATLSLVAAVLIAFSICWSPAAAWSRSPFGAPTSTAAAGAEGVLLWINRTSVKPNGTVKIRVENRGSQPVVVGDPFQLEREEAGTWRRLPGEKPFSRHCFLYLQGWSGKFRLFMSRAGRPGALIASKSG